MAKRIKVGKVLSYEAMCSGYPEPIEDTVARAEKWTADKAPRVRQLIEDGLIEIKPLEKPNFDLMNFDYTHDTEWLPEMGDWYAVEIIEVEE